MNKLLAIDQLYTATVCDAKLKEISRHFNNSLTALLTPWQLLIWLNCNQFSSVLQIPFRLRANSYIPSNLNIDCGSHNWSERESGQCKEMPLVIYLAFLAKVTELYYLILTVFRKYWLDTVAKFMSGTQETFI